MKRSKEQRKAQSIAMKEWWANKRAANGGNTTRSNPDWKKLSLQYDRDEICATVPETTTVSGSGELFKLVTGATPDRFIIIDTQTKQIVSRF